MLSFSFMKACRVHEFGGPEAVCIDDVEVPTAGPRQLLVRVFAAGVGPWDAWIRSGKSVLEQPLPLTLGADLSGVVASVGPDVTGFELGQEVFGVTNSQFTGSHAEFALAEAAGMAAKGKTLGHVDAAAVPVVAVTAWQMLFDHARARAGERVLVHGAGGSVGAAAVQLAHAAGLTVIGTDIGEGCAYARSLFDGPVVDMQHERFEDRADTVDVVIDTVGGAIQRRSFAVLKPGGRLVSSVMPPEQSLASPRGILAKFMLVEVTRAALLRVGELLENQQLSVRVGTVLPLEQARVAQEMLDGTRARHPGKIVLQMNGSES